MRSSVSRGGVFAAAGFLAVQFGLRALFALRIAFDTDEPQHLHVAWAWTRGLVPYRDVFDNHAPLFHLATAPLVAAFGERPELLFAARMAMIPLAIAALAAVFAIGRALFSPSVGLWAAALVGLMPAYLFTSVQFRADDLWAALWLAAIAVAVGGAPSRGRGFAVGLLVGAAFAASMKTSLLLTTLAGGFGIVIAVDPAARERVLGDRRLRAATAAGALAMALVFVAFVALFAWLAALPELLEDVILHNFAAADLWGHRLLRSVMFVATLPLVALVPGWRALRSTRRPVAARTIATATLLYATTLNGFWPIVTRQDCLPLYPLLAVFSTAAIASSWRRADLVFTVAAAAEIALCLYVGAPWRARNAFEIGLVRDVLRLTRPDDLVMDLKGESLFRDRPVYYALENITERRFSSGEIRDDVAERLIATQTHVSVPDSSRFPAATRRFLLENYVPVGHVRVAGKFLEIGHDGSCAFTVAVRGRYTVLSAAGPAAGTLDGMPLEGARMLGRGPHVFRAARAVAPLALVWADAADLGLSPFHPGKPS